MWEGGWVGAGNQPHSPHRAHAGNQKQQRAHPGPSRIPSPEAPLRGGAGTGEGWAFRGWNVRGLEDRGRLIGFRKKSQPSAEACPSPTPAPPAAPGVGFGAGGRGDSANFVSPTRPPSQLSAFCPLRPRAHLFPKSPIPLPPSQSSLPQYKPYLPP